MRRVAIRTAAPAGRSTPPVSLAVLFLISMAAAPAGAEVRLEVAGSVRGADGALEVEVDLENHGDMPAEQVSAEAELLGSRGRSDLPGPLAPGATGRLTFRFPLEAPPPGVYPVALLIDYGSGPAAASPPPVRSSQRAFLLVALGGQAEPPVRLSISSLRLRTYARLGVSLESADGAPHRVRFRIEAPRGLRVLDDPRDVDLPARGVVRVEVGLLRAGVPRGPQGLLAIAESADGPLHRTAVATATVEVVPDEPWLPRLRSAMAVAAGLLLAVSLLAEAKRRRQAGGSGSGSGPGAG